MLKLFTYLAKDKSGFSLVEMSIVLVIIGFIASSAISVAISNDYSTKRDEKESKLDRIEEALAGFLSANHRLPCPADGTVSLSNALFGMEGAPTGTGCPNANFTVNTVSAGVVPARTLSLPDDFMFDGWGRRIDYIMDYRFANNDTNTANAAACTGNTNDPCFRDATAGTITVANRTTGAVYVLLSHGENGHGAFTKNGSTTRINGFPPGNPYRIDSADEFTNAKFSNLGANTPYTATFVMRDYTRVDDVGGVPRVYFDDQVRFKEKQQVIFATGAKIYQPECKTALDVVNGTGSACTGVSDVTQCQTFATEINSRCIQ